MHSDDSTLAEHLDDALLRAGFSSSLDDAALLRRHLADEEPRRRILSLRGAHRRSLLSEGDWLRILSDPAPVVRREAVNLVAGVQDASDGLCERVAHLLDDPDELVVEGAAYALGELQWTEAVDALAAVAKGHDDARCREAAVASLGVLGDDRGRDAVLGALEDKPAVRRRAIVALSNFEGPDIDAALERAREDRDWQVRAAVDQLGRDDD